MTTATLDKPSTNPPTQPPSRIKRVSFGATKPKATETKTKYPVFDDAATGDQVREIAARIKKRAGELEALEGAQKTDKAEIKMFTGPFYWKTNANKTKPPSSISIPSAEGEVLVTFQNRYTDLPDEAPLVAIIGADNAAKFIRQSFKLTINGEELPVGKEQEVVDEIIAVLEKHGASHALEVKEALKPTPDFHVARLTIFTPEQNQQIDQLWPVVAMVKTKGRGEE